MFSSLYMKHLYVDIEQTPVQKYPLFSKQAAAARRGREREAERESVYSVFSEFLSEQASKEREKERETERECVYEI